MFFTGASPLSYHEILLSRALVNSLMNCIADNQSTVVSIGANLCTACMGNFSLCTCMLDILRTCIIFCAFGLNQEVREGQILQFL